MSYVYEKTVVCVRCRSVTYLINDQKVTPEERKTWLCDTCIEEKIENLKVKEETDKKQVTFPSPPPLTPVTPVLNPKSQIIKEREFNDSSSEVSISESEKSVESSVSSFVQKIKDEFRSESSESSSSSDFPERSKRAIPDDFQDVQEQDEKSLPKQEIVPEPINIENSNLTDVVDYDEHIQYFHQDTPRPVGPNQFLNPTYNLRAKCGCLTPTLDEEGLKQLELQNKRKEMKMEMHKEMQRKFEEFNHQNMQQFGSWSRASPTSSFHGPYTSSPASALSKTTKSHFPMFLSRNSSANCSFTRPQPFQFQNSEPAVPICYPYSSYGASSPTLNYCNESFNLIQDANGVCRRFSDKSVPKNYYSNHKPLQNTFYDQPKGHFCMAHSMQSALKNGCVLHGGMIAGKVKKNGKSSKK